MIRQGTTQGFSLAELLLVLLILGNIAAFTIPKVVNSQQATLRKTVFKEVIGVLGALSYQAALTSAVDGKIEARNYFKENINYVRHCGHSENQGCWNKPVQGLWGHVHSLPGVLLANGSSVTGLGCRMTCSQAEDESELSFLVNIDWNSVDGPNLPGDDQILVRICLEPKGCTTVTQRAGSVIPNDATSSTTYQEIYQ